MGGEKEQHLGNSTGGKICRGIPEIKLGKTESKRKEVPGAVHLPHQKRDPTVGPDPKKKDTNPYLGDGRKIHNPCNGDDLLSFLKLKGKSEMVTISPCKQKKKKPGKVEKEKGRGQEKEGHLQKERKYGGDLLFPSIDETQSGIRKTDQKGKGEVELRTGELRLKPSQETASTYGKRGKGGIIRCIWDKKTRLAYHPGPERGMGDAYGSEKGSRGKPRGRRN